MTRPLSTRVEEQAAQVVALDEYVEAIRNDPRVAPYRALQEKAPEDWIALTLWLAMFYPFQLDWLLENADFAISNKSRQIGTSHTSAALGVLWGAFKAELTTIVSIGDTESTEVLDKAHRHVAVLQSLGSKLAATVQSSTRDITFASGGRIKALPSSGGRGFTGNVFLDEFAYQEHATKVWDAAAPVALLGYKIRVVSTPNGIGNEFYDLWDIATNPDRKSVVRGVDAEGESKAIELEWKAHSIPIEKAIAQSYPVDLAKCWQLAKNDPRLFAQMFNCSFLDNVLQYISNDIINDCLTNDLIKPPSQGEFYAGLDIGREVDLSCLVVVHRYQGLVQLVHVETMKRTDSDGLEAMVDRAFEKYKLKRLCIDATGMGSFPTDRVKKKHSERIEVSHRRPRVEAVTFGEKSKEQLATGLYSIMTDQRLVLPFSDEQLARQEGIDESTTPRRKWVVNDFKTATKLRKEIASLQRVISKSGNVLYKTPRTADGHADRAWALMLAVYACSAVNPMVAALEARANGTGREGLSGYGKRKTG